MPIITLILLILLGILGFAYWENYLDDCEDTAALVWTAEYPGLGEARDLFGGGVFFALDDGAGVSEGHAGHVVHEAAGHERDDR